MMETSIFTVVVITLIHANFANFEIIEHSQNVLEPKFSHKFVEGTEKNSQVFSLKKKTLKESEMKVGIVGAGISGLYAAILLQDLGINYEILEASNRIGGRYYTHYFIHKFGNNYVELGAMRFPETPIYDRLIGKQNWSLISYLNARMKSNKKLKLIQYISKTENDIFYFSGIRKYRSEVENKGDLFGFGKKEGGFIDDKFTSRNAFFWNKKAFEYIGQKSNGSESEALKFLLKNDNRTFRGFLMNPSNPNLAYPSDVVDWIEDIVFSTGSFSASFMDVYFDYSLAQSNSLVTIEGGVSKLIHSMNCMLRNKPKLKQVVRRIKQRENNNLIVQAKYGHFEYTHLIMTPTFHVLKDIDFQLKLRLKKKIAMRTIQNAFSVKIGIEFKSRFWENAAVMNGKPLFGGMCATDLRIRSVVYPSNGINCTSCFGSLVIYTLFRDAEKFLAFSNKEILEISLKDLSVIHGEIVYKQFTGKYKIMNWSENKWTQGSFSVFEPGYFRSYYPDLIQPEASGRLHFAGDTLSLYHSWSIGALSSAYRAVKDLLLVEGLNEKIKLLEYNWGKIDEPAFVDFQQ